MNLTDHFIKKPVFASVLSLLLLAIGIISYQHLTLRQFPKIDANVISIDTSYTGATPEVMEGYITTPIENAIAGVDDIDYITSTSTAGSSHITINLTLNADVDHALVNVNSNISSALRSLPTDADTPITQEMDSNSTPTLIFSVASPNMSMEAVSDYLTRSVIPVLSTLNGVGTAEILGQREYAMRIWLNAHQMSNLGISTTDIQDALADNNVQAQPGEIDRVSQNLTINADTDLKTADDFSNLIIKFQDQRLVRLRDVASIELGANDTTTMVKSDNKEVTGVAITPKTDANPLDVNKEVKKTLEKIAPTLPNQMTYSIMHETSTYIQDSIDEVIQTILEASVFVMIVIFLFIGSLRAITVPLVTIPLSLIGAFAIMFAMGYTLNTITLLSFVLAIGMVVDDAIVVLENIHRHLELGLTPVQAALKGAQEIQFAVIAMTITLAAVYAPIGFVGGLTGSMFKEFAFTLAGTVIISGFIALTLSPMMCSKLMNHATLEGPIAKRLNSFLTRVTQGYKHMLVDTFTYQKSILCLGLTILIAGAAFSIPLMQTSILAPDEDQGTAFAMATGPSAGNVASTIQSTDKLADIYKTVPERDKYVIVNGRPLGENTAMSFISFVDWSKRHRSAAQIIAYLNSMTRLIPGLTIFVMNPSSLPASNSSYPLEFVLKTTGSYAELNQAAAKMIYEAEKNPGFQKLQSDLKLDKPEVKLTFDRNKINLLGITMQNVATALSVAFGQPETTTFVIDGMSYDVIPQMMQQFRGNIEDIGNIMVHTMSGTVIPLSSFTTIQTITSPSSLNHFQQQRSATISGVLSSSYSTNEAIDYLKALAIKDLPSDISYDYSGETRQYVQEGGTMVLVFLFALIFIYLVLSAQFESFRDPLIVLITVPLSLSGAMAALYLSGGSLNIYTDIGLVTLIGLISKHGILIVDFANHKQIHDNLSPQQAVIEATAIRFRPILMTTAAIILGALPLILASGAGATSRSQMGWVISGGMAVGTLLTLFVLPHVYALCVTKKQVTV